MYNSISYEDSNTEVLDIHSTTSTSISITHSPSKLKFLKITADFLFWCRVKVTKIEFRNGSHGGGKAAPV